jgi:dolichol-phosphate mannosyltransferase
MKLSILIPVYNEEKTIAQIIRQVNDLKIRNIKKEIIVIDDGSTDKTVTKIPKNKIKFIQHDKNLGKGSAIQTGIRKATGDYIIIQDADLEYDPKFIKTLVQPIIENKAKVVYGTRLKRLPNLKKDEKNFRFFLHYFGNRFLSLITSLLYGSWITDMETCYKLFPTSVGKKLKLKAKRFDFEPEITAKLLKKGYKIVEVPISTVPRNYNEGKKLKTFHDGTIALYTLLKYRIYD